MTLAQSWTTQTLRWLAATVAATALMVAVAGVLRTTSVDAPALGTAPAAAPTSATTPPVAELARTAPDRKVRVIVQLRPGADDAAIRTAVRAAGGKVERELSLIDGLAIRTTAAAAADLGSEPGVRAVSLDARVKGTSSEYDGDGLATSYVESVRAHKAWRDGHTGEGVGVAVVDTGIQGDLPDFRTSPGDHRSRVVASAVVNPAASNARDTFGHGTHVAGLIAGNGGNLDEDDPLRARYAGVAPEADLISVKADDGHGQTSVIDIIDALQFVVDHKDDYGIRVVNLSMSSTVAESYLTDPLDAAVEATWFAGIVVVAAAGNRGEDDDAVSYAPGNDPYVITVGGVDDRGTKATRDDALASWSSRGTTQDGFRKPEIVAPGARLVSTMAPGADYLSLCESCVVDGRYFRVGGTSMAAGVVSGAVADILDAHPDWSPDQVKAAIVKTGRKVRKIDSLAQVVVDEDGAPEVADDDLELHTGQVAREIAVDRAIHEPGWRRANQGLTPNELIDPETGGIDYNRASWTRASWTEATDFMRASWTRASWTRASWTRASWTATNENCADFERASWTRASWTDAELDQAFDECLELARSRDDLSDEEAEALRASWTRASWTRASWTRASWTRASWTRASWTRASWTRASWTRASWTASFHK